MKHDITDPVTIASVLVRDHFDTVIQRHSQAEKDQGRTREDRAVSFAVVRLAQALLAHLPGEAKQARADQ